MSPRPGDHPPPMPDGWRDVIVYDLGEYRLERRPTGPEIVPAEHAPPPPRVRCPACGRERDTSTLVSAVYCSGGHRGERRHPMTACEAIP